MKNLIKKSNKEVKIIAINQLHAYAKQVFNYEREYYKTFLGVNIFKVDGSLKAKFVHDKLPDLKITLEDETFVNAQYWFTNRHGYFEINVKICVNGGSYDVQPNTAFCQYENQCLTIFRVSEEGKLIDTVNDIEWLDKVYTIEELNQQAQKIKEVAEQYNALVNSFPYVFKGVFDIERLTR